MSINLDYYAPGFKIEIDGIKSDDIKILHMAVMSIEINDSIDAPGMFTINLNEGLNLETQEMTWLDSSLLDPESGKDVRVYLDYARGAGLQRDEPLITGKIVALSPSFPSSGNPTLSVQGYDDSFFMQKLVIEKKKLKALFDSAENYGDIAKAVAKFCSLEEGDIEDSIKKCESMRPGPDTSVYQFMRDLADRLGFEFFTRNKKLYFRSPKDGLISGSNGGTDELGSLKWGREILSFSPRLSTAKAVSKVTVRGHNQKSPSKPITGTASLEDLTISEKKVKSAGESAKAAMKGEIESTKHDFPVCNEEDAKTLARAILHKANCSLIEGSCECIGMPEIRPGTTVLIEGVGKKFSGAYYIKSARHSLGDGGYALSLEVRRGVVGTV